MLDAFTSFMCVESWGRIGYARALIEVWASKELKEEVIMVVPIVDDNGDTTGYTKERIRVEYEWKPPLCLECHVFGHYAEMCPKRVTQPVTKTNDANNDGFMAVNNRKKKGKALAHTKPSEGLKMNKQKDDLLQDREVGETSGINNEAKVAEPDPNMSSDNEVEEMVIEPDPRVTKLKGASTPS
ncbi:trichome birefringence-like protein 3 [Tanacetum coccineum]